MKRPPKSFVVEHKRRARSAGGEPPSIWSGAIGSQMRTLVGAGERDAPEPPASRPARPAKIGAATRSAGRILMARQPEPVAGEADAIEDAEPAPVAKTGVARPRRAVAVAERRGERAEPAPAPHGDEAPASPAIPSAPGSAIDGPAPATLSYSQRRRAMTKGLPFGERWKRGL